MPEHRAEAHMQQHQQQAIVREAQAQEALNEDHKAGNREIQPGDIPQECRPYREPQSQHSLGPMDLECAKCGAMHFMSEKLTRSAKRSPKFGVCCLQGQIQLPPLPPLPAALKSLYDGSDANSKHFLENIRRYNTAFAFTS